MADIDTTLSLREEHILLIRDKAKGLGIKPNQILLELFAAMAARAKEKGVMEGAIGYQEAQGGYGKMHVYLTYDEYEQKLDMRRFYKMSASKVVAWAIDNILEELLENWYYFDNYQRIVNVYYQQKHEILPIFSQKYVEYRVIWGSKPG